eukprot:jgi/Chlat1/4377/Chrsp29S04522
MRLAPWASWAEWEQVRAWLRAAATHADVRRGLQRVAAWRCRGRVPLAVEVTAALMEARSHDPGVSPDCEEAYSEEILRLTYAMTIIRLVNGIADQSQKNKFAASVALLAANAGLPQLLVDARHDAAHNALPSLPNLRVAVNEALAWLEAYYWQQQEGALTDINKTVEGALQDFCNAFHRTSMEDSQDSQHQEEVGGDSDAKTMRMALSICKLHGAQLGRTEQFAAMAADFILHDAKGDTSLAVAEMFRRLEQDNRRELPSAFCGQLLHRMLAAISKQHSTEAADCQRVSHQLLRAAVSTLSSGAEVAYPLQLDILKTALQLRNMQWIPSELVEELVTVVAGPAAIKHRVVSLCRLSSLQPNAEDHTLNTTAASTDAEAALEAAKAVHTQLLDSARANQKAQQQEVATTTSSETCVPWRLSKLWRPCAIGMLPSPYTYNGTLPDFGDEDDGAELGDGGAEHVTIDANVSVVAQLQQAQTVMECDAEMAVCDPRAAEVRQNDILCDEAVGTPGMRLFLGTAWCQLSPADIKRIQQAVTRTIC